MFWSPAGKETRCFILSLTQASLSTVSDSNNSVSFHDQTHGRYVTSSKTMFTSGIWVPRTTARRELFTGGVAHESRFVPDGNICQLLWALLIDSVTSSKIVYSLCCCCANVPRLWLERFLILDCQSYCQPYHNRTSRIPLESPWELFAGHSNVNGI